VWLVAATTQMPAGTRRCAADDAV